jgi:hypothetical protein
MRRMRSRGWIFVLNNYDEKEFEEFKDLETKYTVIGEEVGDSGTPHLQGYVYFANKMSLKQLRLINSRAHYEMQKGTCDQAADYCKKDGKFFEKGNFPKRGRPKNRIEDNKKLLSSSIRELVENGEISVYSVPRLKKARVILEQENDPYTHNDTRGEWYYGEPGAGKSRKAREENPDAFIKSQNKWFDGYSGEKVIILDDLDTNILGHYLKIWADRYSCSGEIKGGTVNLQHEKFIVTSNYHPKDLWKDDEQMCMAICRRFKIVLFKKVLDKCE